MADSVVPGGQVGRRKTEPNVTLTPRSQAVGVRGRLRLSERGKKSPRGLLNTLTAMSRKRLWLEACGSWGSGADRALAAWRRRAAGRRRR